ncbi:hypothetical protein [Agrobacterium sp. DSM 25558]|uniref:hypothetical protein n=1 Tax=Agrobacterium sp. DSM 25558 TaxID=1907665 RepID=UPI0013563F6A|nr:hypothetical protein [Agrobacterium sp. DSM 25558]
MAALLRGYEPSTPMFHCQRCADPPWLDDTKLAYQVIKWRFNKLNMKSCRKKKSRRGLEQDRKQTDAQAPDMAVAGIAGFHAVYDLRVSPDNVSP